MKWNLQKTDTIYAFRNLDSKIKYKNVLNELPNSPKHFNENFVFFMSIKINTISDNYNIYQVSYLSSPYPDIIFVYLIVHCCWLDCLKLVTKAISSSIPNQY